MVLHFWVSSFLTFQMCAKRYLSLGQDRSNPFHCHLLLLTQFSVNCYERVPCRLRKFIKTNQQPKPRAPAIYDAQTEIAFKTPDRIPRVLLCHGAPNDAWGCLLAIGNSHAQPTSQRTLFLRSLSRLDAGKWWKIGKIIPSR